jgi:hypothetical protein
VSFDIIITQQQQQQQQSAAAPGSAGEYGTKSLQSYARQFLL